MKSFTSVALVISLFSVASSAPYESYHNQYQDHQDQGLGRVKEVAVAIRNSPYPKEAYGLEPYDNPSHIDNAKQEHEAIPSKVLSGYDGLHKKTSDFFNPKPIVDGIKEEDKYGNEGDKFYFATKLVTKGLEQVSNLLNKIVDSPIAVIDKLSKGLTSKLDEVGAKIVGLTR